MVKQHISAVCPVPVYAHSHITRAVAAMDSCFVLVSTHQYGIVPGREPNKVQGIICPLLSRRVQSTHLGTTTTLRTNYNRTKSQTALTDCNKAIYDHFKNNIFIYPVRS